MDFNAEHITVKVEIFDEENDEDFIYNTEDNVNENKEDNYENNKESLTLDNKDMEVENTEENEAQLLCNRKDLSESKEEFDGTNKELSYNKMDAEDADVTEDDENLDNTQEAIEDDSSKEGKTIYCHICHEIVKNKARLRHHIRHEHADEFFLECSKCDRTFRSQANLKSHEICSHPKPGTEVACDECGKVFANKKKLGNHKYYTHAAPDESVSCEICKKTFKKQYKLNVHNRQVHLLNLTATCQECGKVYKNEILLRRHMKWSHPLDELDHECEECGKHFPSYKHYKKHKDNSHSAPEGLKCVLCERVLANKKSMTRHMQTHARGKVFPKPKAEGDFPCTICEKRFNTKTSLYWHGEKDHSEHYQLKNSCHICFKEYADHHVLRRHLESIHSIETATCKICNKTYKSPMNLESHMRTTHAPPEAAKTCKICQKVFKCALHLRIHIKAVHPPGKEFVCDICNRPFVSKRYLFEHKKTHATMRDFECEECGKTFKRKVDVNKHIRRVHRKPAKPVSTCLKCDRKFTSDARLHIHIKKCKGEETPLPVVKIEVVDEEINTELSS